jgi:capsular exopolysaccharide synthesis family protein
MTPHNPGYNDPSNPPPPHLPPVQSRNEPAAPTGRENAPPAALTASPNMGGLLRALGRRWMLAVCLGLPLAALAGAGAWYLMAPRYTAVAQVRVAYDDGNVFNPLGLGGTAYTTLMKSVGAQIRGRGVINEAVKRSEVRQLNLEARYPDPAALSAHVEDDLKIENTDGSEFLTILMSADDPNEAVTLLRAVTRTYMDRNVYDDKEAKKKRLADLTTLHTEKVQNIVKKKNRLDALGKSLGTDSAEKLAALRTDLIDAKHRRDAMQLELEKTQIVLKAQDGKVAPNETSPALEALLIDAEARDGNGVVLLKQRIKRYEDVLRDFDKNPRSPTPPTVIASRERVAELKKDLEDRRKELRADLAVRLKNVGPMSEAASSLIQRKIQEGTCALLTHHLDILNNDIKLLTDKTENIKKTNADMEALDADIKSEENVVASLNERIQKQQVEIRQPDRITLSQEAELQKKDVKKQLMAAAAAPFAVLFLVCAGLAMGEYRKRKIHNVGEVSRGLGIRVVGAVPHLPNLEHRLVGPTGEPELEGHPALESIDALRTLLLTDANASATRIVLVTSAAPGEGKTTLASHLASSLARAGRKTLLIDGDLRAPAVHQLFETPLQPGFSEVLLAEVESADAVQPTTIEGLSVMSAGQWDRTVLQALARDGLEGVFEKLRQEFEFLVIDSHPVLAAADSLLLAQKADAVILSVLRQVSQMPRVYAASQRLTSLGVRVLGAVVNAADPNEVFPDHVGEPTPAAA